MSESSINKTASPEQMRLMRDIAKLVNNFNNSYPNVDAVEVMAVIGATAGACISSCPDQEGRVRARESLIISMDAAILDFLPHRDHNHGSN